MHALHTPAEVHHESQVAGPPQNLPTQSRRLSTPGVQVSVVAS
jgi:hypothetical protein